MDAEFHQFMQDLLCEEAYELGQEEAHKWLKEKSYPVNPYKDDNYLSDLFKEGFNSIIKGV